jgi:hypothetical protein
LPFAAAAISAVPQWFYAQRHSAALRGDAMRSPRSRDTAHLSPRIQRRAKVDHQRARQREVAELCSSMQRARLQP